MSRKDKVVEEVQPDTLEGFVVQPLFDEDGVQVSSGIGRNGKEYPDPVPMAPPVEFLDKTSDLVRRLVFNELRQLAQDKEFETIEEADDFDIEDDPIDPLTPYERYFEPKPSPVTPVDQKNTAEAKVAGEGGPQPTGAPPIPVVKKENSTST